MEEHNYDSKQLKEGQKYTLIFIAIVMSFGFFSYLILAYGYHASEELRNTYIAIYAAFFSIIGGLIGGLITLEGVRRTVYAQRDIESQKLIPNKLVNLYKLRKETAFFMDIGRTISDIRVNMEVNELLYAKKLNDPHPTYLIPYLDVYYKIQDFTLEKLNEVEYKFVEIAFEIDRDLYKEISRIFTELKLPYQEIYRQKLLTSFPIEYPLSNSKKTIDHFYNEYKENKIHLREFVQFLETEEEIDYNDIINSIIKCTDHIEETEKLLIKLHKELNSTIDAKLNSYEKSFNGI